MKQKKKDKKVYFYQGGNEALELELQNSIIEYLKEKSTIASNRLVVNKAFRRRDKNPQRWQSARYLEDNQTELFKAFQSDKEITRKTFRKYLKKSSLFKKPCRLTDLCEYCEKLKKLTRSLRLALNQLNYQSPAIGQEEEIVDINHAKNFLETKRNEPQIEQDVLTKVIFSRNFQ